MRWVAIISLAGLGCRFDSGGAGAGSGPGAEDDTGTGPGGPGGTTGAPTAGSAGTASSATTLSGSSGGTDTVDPSDSATSTGPGTGWAEKRRLTVVDMAALAAVGLADFPVLVTLTPERISYGVMRPDGADLRFFASDESTPLPYEVEAWDPAGTSQVWVTVPAISNQPAEDHFWLYAGHPEMDDGQDPQAVWATDYVGVWHLADDPESAPPEFVDATQNGFDGEAQGGLTASSVVAGQVAAGLRVDGGAQRIEVADAVGLTPPAGVTVSGWVYLEQNPVDDFRALLLKRSSVYLAALRNESFNSSPTDPAFGLTLQGSGTGVLTHDVALGSQWRYVAGTYEPETGAQRFYIDGALVAERTSVSDATMAQTANPLALGYQLPGIIDEIRVVAQARDGAWIAAQHASMTDVLLHYGDPEVP